MSTEKPIAVIPARGGSQRIPGKNLRPMLGQPLVARVISTCLKSSVFEAVVVSTDSPAIAQLALESGAGVINRPSSLADHHTPLLPVIAHAVADTQPDTPVCCVYATAVTLTPDDLIHSWARFAEMMEEDRLSTNFLTGVVEYSHPIQRALVLSETGAIAMLQPEFAQTRTQDLPPRWHDAGVFIWGTAQSWVRPEAVLTRAYGFPLPQSQIIDIDTEEDWIAAERVLSIQIDQS